MSWEQVQNNPDIRALYSREGAFPLSVRAELGDTIAEFLPKSDPTPAEKAAFLKQIGERVKSNPRAEQDFKNFTQEAYVDPSGVSKSKRTATVAYKALREAYEAEQSMTSSLEPQLGFFMKPSVAEPSVKERSPLTSKPAKPRSTEKSNSEEVFAMLSDVLAESTAYAKPMEEDFESFY